MNPDDIPDDDRENDENIVEVDDQGDHSHLWFDRQLREDMKRFPTMTLDELIARANDKDDPGYDEKIVMEIQRRASPAIFARAKSMCLWGLDVERRLTAA